MLSPPQYRPQPGAALPTGCDTTRGSTDATATEHGLRHGE